MAAYGFLAAYAFYSMQAEQLEAKKMRLSVLNQRQAELLRKQDLVKAASDFHDGVTTLKLNKQNWLFYDVNVEGQFQYEAAQLIVQQCSDSALAYYWPLTLEIKAITKSGQGAKSGDTNKEQKDVQLMVKGKFVARK